MSEEAFSQKPLVCTVTINSSEEKDVFETYLGEDFNFVELTEYGTEEEGKRDWFLGACKQGIECDILVVSGHFGGSFFGTSGYRLGLPELQRRSCQKACDGILKKPREVFLFGCNTTAGKSQDHRTPEEYTRVLMEDGFSRRQAEQISAFRYSPIGQETKERMRQVFPHSRIYGFHSQAPRGKSIAPRLKSYFESIADYKVHLEQFPTAEENGFWSSAMSGQWIRSVDGDGGIENPVCVLEEDIPIYKKLYWVEEVLSDRERSLSYIPVIDVYLRDLERRFGGWEGLPGEELSLLERIQYNDRGRGIVEELLERPIRGVVLAQVQVLNFGQRVGWYDEEAYSERLKGLIGDIFKENLDREQKDFICSLEVELGLSLEDLPDERWNEHTITAIGCVKPKDVRVHLALVELLKDTEESVHWLAAEVLGEIKSDDSQVLLALTEALKDTEATVRWWAAEALGEIKSDDSQVLLALTEALKDTDRSVRKRAARALGEIKSDDPQVLLALTEALNDTNAGVRRRAAEALGEIKSDDSQVLLALTEALKDTEESVRRRAAEALGEIKSDDPKVLLALTEALKDTEAMVRRMAANALGEIKSDDSQVLLALIEALKDTDATVRWLAAVALGKIKSDDSKVLLALTEALKDTEESVRRRAAEALGEIKSDDPQVLLALTEALNDTEAGVREMVAWTLGEIKSDDPQVLLALTEALKDTDKSVRRWAAEALGEIKSDDPKVLLALTEALTDTVASVREAVRQALVNIQH